MSANRPARLVCASALAVAVVFAAAVPVTAGHAVDEGWVHTGVGSEQEAKAYPCPGAAAGGWERTGPVVCLQKRASTWSLTHDAEGNCSWYPTGGWRGSCVFDVDMGDHVRVWGTSGIAMTRFRLDWGHAEARSTAPPPPSAGPDGEPSGGAGDASQHTGDWDGWGAGYGEAPAPDGSTAGRPGGFTFSQGTSASPSTAAPQPDAAVDGGRATAPQAAPAERRATDRASDAPASEDTGMPAAATAGLVGLVVAIAAAAALALRSRKPDVPPAP